MVVWVVRGGRGGSYAQWALDNGRVAAAWNSVPSLADAASREEVMRLVEPTMDGESRVAVGIRATQLWGLRQIAPGDVVVLPLSASSTLAVGTCISGYEHLDGSAPARHTVRVDWQRDDVPRAALASDLLASLGSLMTVFQISRNGAEERFAQIMATGLDPEASEAEEPAQTPTEQAGGGEAAGETDAVLDRVISTQTLVDPQPVPTLESIRDRVRVRVRESFREHDLTALVAAILEVRGFVCDVSPPGKDHGVDILAGTGPLGLDSPTLIVEVKSEPTAVAAPIVRGLQGAMLSHRADQGLLVAWGGITKDARSEIRKDRLSMRVWNADDLLEQLLEVYERLPDDLRAQIPLKRAWVLTEPGDL